MSKKKGTFKKGDPRINRSGRPKKGQTLTGILRKFGKKKEVEINGKMYSRNEAIAIILWEKAIVGRDRKCIEYIYNRIDGLPTQPMEGDFNHTGIEKNETVIINNTDERMDKVLGILESIKGLRKRVMEEKDNSETE